MRMHKIDQLLVLSDGGQVLGTITESDIARARFELISSTERYEWTLAQTPSDMSVK